MLAKAQNNYLQSKTSENDLSGQPKPIGNWPSDYHINSNTYVKPEAIRIQPTLEATNNPSSTSPSKYQENSINSSLVKSQSQQQSINPIIQRLLSFDPNTTPNSSASTTMIGDISFSNENNNELLSLELKRKLNIIKLPNEETTLMTPNALLNQQKSSVVFTPQNSTKNLMTVKDFEANLLANESMSTKPSSSVFVFNNDNNGNDASNLTKPHQQPVFYLESNQIRPNKLQLINENSDISSQKATISIKVT